MSRSLAYNVTDDIDGQTTGVAPDGGTLPPGWVHVTIQAWDANGDVSVSEIDVSPTNTPDLSSLPPTWQTAAPAITVAVTPQPKPLPPNQQPVQ